MWRNVRNGALVRCLLLLLLPPLLLPLLRGQRSSKGPISLAPTKCFVVVEPHVQKIWKERGFLKNPEIKSPANSAHFFSVCFARSTAYVTLWNIMLQMPINRIQRIARKEDGGRASCAAAVHNTQLLAQIEELWWVFFFSLSVFSAGAGAGWCGSRAGELHA